MTTTHLACSWCVLARGIRGADVHSLPTTQDELWDHVELEHKIIMCRPGETKEDATARYYAKFPERRP